jgi:hypothetical protein
MKEEYLRNLLSQVNYISTVTFSGGEPTLPSGLKAIDMFIDLCYEYNVGVGNFYIVTNGKVWRSKLPRTIWRLYNLCDENDISGIDVSSDQFHESGYVERSDFRYRLQEALWEEGITEDQLEIRERGEIEHEYVIMEGRGKNFSGRDMHKELNALIWEVYNYEKEEPELSVREGNVYLNCKGNIITGCDWSFKSQDEEEQIICHSSDDIIKAVKNKCHTEEEFWENLND